MTKYKYEFRKDGNAVILAPYDDQSGGYYEKVSRFGSFGYDPLYQPELDKKFIKEFKKRFDITEIKVSEDISKVDFFSNIVLYEKPQLVSTDYTIENMVSYNDYETTCLCSTLEGAMETLKQCSNWRPHGKTPILGSGDIIQWNVYAYQGNEYFYRKRIFRSYGDCVPVRIDDHYDVETKEFLDRVSKRYE